MDPDQFKLCGCGAKMALGASVCPSGGGVCLSKGWTPPSGLRAIEIVEQDGVAYLRLSDGSTQRIMTNELPWALRQSSDSNSVALPLTTLPSPKLPNDPCWRHYTHDLTLPCTCAKTPYPKF